MTHNNSTTRLDETAAHGTCQSLQSANHLASRIKRRWQEAGQADVAALLANHPGLERYRSVVLDLALEEYRQRAQAGEEISSEEFAQRFPHIQRSLLMLIEVDKLLGSNSRWTSLLEETDWPQAGDVFLGFHLMAELGRGTFGRVFLASETALGGRSVAVKLAPYGGQEAEILGRLRHPNIVSVYSVQEDSDTGLTAVCMPYLGRTTLADVLDRACQNRSQPTSCRFVADLLREQSEDKAEFEVSSVDRILLRGTYVEGVVHFAAQLAEALAYAHGQGVCHRDLKPSNVLISLEGRPLLLDFNLSSHEQVDLRKVGGTIPYMAPEQLRALLSTEEREGSADPRSDVFSLGVILFELLTGSLPFGPLPTERPLEKVAGHLLSQQECGPNPIRERNRCVDPQLAKWIERCLAFNPHQRPQSAGELAAGLRRQLATGRRVKRWASAHRLWVAAAGCLLTVLLIGVGMFVALQDPYSVRQYKYGRLLAAQGQLASAIRYFNQALQADPQYAEAILARGHAHQKQGNFHLAFEDFQILSRMAPTTESAICKGYCLAKLGHHREAIAELETLVGKSKSPVLLNNIGYSYLQLGKLDDARQHLERALGANDQLAAAHHNLLIVLLTSASGGQPFGDRALYHARRAVELGPPSAELYLNVAAAFALASETTSSLVPSALDYLTLAVEHGLDPHSALTDPRFFSIRDQQAFLKLMVFTGSTKIPTRANRLVDPLAGR